MPLAHDASVITITGTETGDSVRSYIASNGLGTVIARTTTLARSLRAASGASFTDSDCTWIFPGTYHIDNIDACDLFEIIDGVIIYTEGAKSHTSALRSLATTLTNVQYRIEGGTGRSDFFSNQDCSYSFSNVQFISYGGSNFLHLATTGGLLEDVALR
jgi:hypothetical protein